VPPNIGKSGRRGKRRSLWIKGRPPCHTEAGADVVECCATNKVSAQAWLRLN
jgi:hypothetical protein